MTPHQAKQCVRTWLMQNGFPDYRLTARNVSFVDLARGGKLFVYVHGWKADPRWDDLRKYSVELGFSVMDA